MSDTAAGPESAEAGLAEPTLGEKIWEQVSTLGLAVLIALAIRAFVIEPFRIPSGSMLPTLLIGDHLFVNKFIYGAQIPFTNVRLPAIREPKRGDVVVFRVARDARGGIYPADERPDLPKDDFVKRIVGLPGERIEVRPGGEVFVDGRAIELEDQGRTFRDENGRHLKVGVESLRMLVRSAMIPRTSWASRWCRSSSWSTPRTAAATSPPTSCRKARVRSRSPAPSCAGVWPTAG